jgi:hypothetical protein
VPEENGAARLTERDRGAARATADENEHRARQLVDHARLWAGMREIERLCGTLKLRVSPQPLEQIRQLARDVAESSEALGLPGLSRSARALYQLLTSFALLAEPAVPLPPGTFLLLGALIVAGRDAGDPSVQGREGDVPRSGGGRDRAS